LWENKEKNEAEMIKKEKHSNDKLQLKPIPMSEIVKHKTKDSLWTVIHGTVYDLTEFMNIHPGGANKIIAKAGKDASGLFS
jgi:cytochrome b involved in lipid metabolism